MILRGKLLAVQLRGRAAAVAVLIVTTGAVQANVRVSGDATAVQLNATAATVAEALSALQSRFRVRVKASTSLDRSIGGIYTGALPKIVSSLLQGYNYFIKRHGAEIEVIVIGSQGDRAAEARRARVTAGGAQDDRTAPAQPPRGVPGNAFSLADAVRLKIH